MNDTPLPRRLLTFYMGLALAVLQLPVLGGSKLIPFQGRLTDASGGELSGSTRVIQFKIYDAPVGGNVKWAGETQKLTINGGLVNTTLGSTADLSSVDFNQPLYLELTVDADGNELITPADPPLLPRQTIFPAAFSSEAGLARHALEAKHAQEADLLQGHSADKLPANVPVGGVLMWWGDRAEIPQGFELCDGMSPSTPNAVLKGLKPNLLDKFPKAAPGSANKLGDLAAGGAHTTLEMTTEGHAITMAQMPAHNHTGTTGDDTPDHSHGFGGYQFGSEYGNGNTAVNLGVAPNGFYRQTDGANRRHQHSIQFEGGNQPHSHTIKAHENRPAFQEMFFIIRVK